MNIYQRINLVMSEVSYVKKDAQISGIGANYSAVTHDQVVSILRSAMVKNGIVCYPEQVKGEMLIMRDGVNVKMHLYQGEYKVHFVGIDEGDELVCVVQSHANDNGDKAPGKALTYAVKSAMLKVFNLETGVNDESREDVREEMRSPTLTQDHAKELGEALKGHTQIMPKILAAYKIANLLELKQTKFQECKERIEKAVTAMEQKA
jgi:hypothetical protein